MLELSFRFGNYSFISASIRMKSKRKFRFGLKSLLLLMAVVCVACGYYAWNADHYAAIETLLENGNRVQWKRETPNSLDRMLGIYRFDSVKCVEPLNAHSDFDAIANLNFLEEFRSDHLFTDFDPLFKHCNTLRSFSMFDIPVEAGPFLSTTRNLEELTGNTWQGFNLGWIAKNRNLKALYVTNATGLEHLETFKELEYLQAPQELESLEAIRHMTKLEHLCFTGSKVRSLEPIKDLKSLKYIEFEECPIPEDEIRAFLESLPEDVKAYGCSRFIDQENETP